MSFSPERLWTQILEHTPWAASAEVCIAFSGGMDSTALLLAAAGLRVTHPKLSVRAIHVDHQLQMQSAAWAQHCEALARKLRVEFTAVTVSVARNSAEGIESAARTARYEVFRERLRPGELLLTAHHADDQLETVLLALARGAGVRGLAAMREAQRFGAGWLLRPMLSFTRDEIEGWMKNQRVDWIHDPTNDDAQFDRNLLRSQVLPALKARWPAIAETASRSVRHIAEADALLDDLARLDLADTAVGPCLRVAALAVLSSARRRNLIRYWLRAQGIRPPSTRKLAALEHDVLQAAQDRQPASSWDGYEVRRYRGLLYASTAVPSESVLQPREWNWHEPLDLGHGLGRIALRPGAIQGLDESRLPERLFVNFDREGVRLRASGTTHHRELKKLLQEAGVLPWWRSCLPMIRDEHALIAVGDLWIAHEFASSASPGARIVWEERPPIFAARQ